MVDHEGADPDTNTYTHNVGDRIEYYIDFTVPNGIVKPRKQWCKNSLSRIEHS